MFYHIPQKHLVTEFLYLVLLKKACDHSSACLFPGYRQVTLPIQAQNSPRHTGVNSQSACSHGLNIGGIRKKRTRAKSSVLFYLFVSSGWNGSALSVCWLCRAFAPALWVSKGGEGARVGCASPWRSYLFVCVFLLSLFVVIAKVWKLSKQDNIFKRVFVRTVRQKQGRRGLCPRRPLSITCAYLFLFCGPFGPSPLCPCLGAKWRSIWRWKASSARMALWSLRPGMTRDIFS